MPSIHLEMQSLRFIFDIAQAFLRWFRRRRHWYDHRRLFDPKYVFMHQDLYLRGFASIRHRSEQHILGRLDMKQKTAGKANILRLRQRSATCSFNVIFDLVDELLLQIMDHGENLQQS